MHNKKHDDMDMQLEINSKLENSILSLREKNNDLNVSLTRFKEKTKKEKHVMKQTINNLNERVQHLVEDLKLQMVSCSKIDTVRQKLWDTVSQLQSDKQQLENENAQSKLTINDLKAQIESAKPSSGGHEEYDHREFSQAKTKGTFSDRDNSQHRYNLGKITVSLPQSIITKLLYLEDQKSNWWLEHIEKAKALEKQNQELEWELRKMMNISKQDTSNISEIINQSLDVLNDISITIEVMAPVSSKSYSLNQLTLSQEKFAELEKHK